MQGQQARVVGDVAQLEQVARRQAVGRDVADHRARARGRAPRVDRGRFAGGRAVVQHRRSVAFGNEHPRVFAAAPAPWIRHEPVGVRGRAFRADRGVRVADFCLRVHGGASGRRGRRLHERFTTAFWQGLIRPWRTWSRMRVLRGPEVAGVACTGFARAGVGPGDAVL